MCKKEKLLFIDHSNINTKTHLNRSKLHLNRNAMNAMKNWVRTSLGLFGTTMLDSL